VLRHAQRRSYDAEEIVSLVQKVERMKIKMYVVLLESALGQMKARLIGNR